jgi:hypothetical protein
MTDLDPNGHTEITETLMRLPSKFIHTHGYLALYYTPLRQLLSLTGNTWLFGKKLTSHTDFDAIAPAIRSWSRSPAATHATMHACHVLKHFLGPHASNRSFRGVSEYWFLYTSALIIWAFGHRATKPSVSGTRSASTSHDASTVTLNTEDDLTHKQAAAHAWAEAIIALKPEQLFKSPLRTKTSIVVEAAYLMLKEESAMSHGQSGMLLDACGVLERIREGGRRF